MDAFLVCTVLIQIGVCFSFGSGDVLLTDPKEGVFKSRKEVVAFTHKKENKLYFPLSFNFPAADKCLTL